MLKRRCKREHNAVYVRVARRRKFGSLTPGSVSALSVNGPNLASAPQVLSKWRYSNVVWTLFRVLGHQHCFFLELPFAPRIEQREIQT